MMGEKTSETEGHFLELAAQLERYAAESQVKHLLPDAVETAAQLRNLLLQNQARLSSEGKVNIVKMVNRLKVRALLREDAQGVEMFHTLESVSEDLMQVF